MLQIKNTLGGGKPEGLYAWKKNTLSFGEKSTASGQEVTHSSTATGTPVNVYYSTEYTFDTLTGTYTLVNPSVISVSYGSQATIDATNYVMFETDSGSVMYKADGSTLYLRNNSSGLSMMAQSSSYKVSVYGSETVKTFVDYVVSDKETAYPDGGVHTDGYYYERVSEGITPEMFGCTKVAVEDKTYSSNTSMYNGGNGITHSLGVAPKVVILLAKTSVTSEMMSFFYNGNEPIVYTPEYMYSYISYGSVYVSYGTMSDLTDSKIVTSGNVYLKAGVTYTLITMA